LSQNESLRIGIISGDADGIQTLDDGSDEDGIANFPYFTTDGTYSLNIPLRNTTGSDAFLTGWFDYDQSGTFTPNESLMVTVPDNATTATLKWNGLPVSMPVSGNFGFRFRLSSDEIAVQKAVGYAKDGEIEDYLIPASELMIPMAGFI